MDLKTSKVHRNLEAKWKIGPFEGVDLLFVLLLAAVMNLLFGETSISFLMVIGVPGIIAVALLIGKRGKPDKYLIHLLRYFVQPGHYPAGIESKKRDQMKHLIVRK